MSVNVQIIGRLGNNPEIKTSKNGKQFVTYRLATDDFHNGKKETSWFNVIDVTERGFKIVEYLKKGSLINIRGSESVSIFTNKNGEPQISRDIIADKVEFISTKNNDADNQETTQKQEKNLEPSMSCGTLNKPVDLAAPIENDDDDLPF